MSSTYYYEYFGMERTKFDPYAMHCIVEKSKIWPLILHCIFADSFPNSSSWSSAIYLNNFVIFRFALNLKLLFITFMVHFTNCIDTQTNWQHQQVLTRWLIILLSGRPESVYFISLYHGRFKNQSGIWISHEPMTYKVCNLWTQL